MRRVTRVDGYVASGSMRTIINLDSPSVRERVRISLTCLFMLTRIRYINPKHLPAFGSPCHNGEAVSTSVRCPVGCRHRFQEMLLSAAQPQGMRLDAWGAPEAPWPPSAVTYAPRRFQTHIPCSRRKPDLSPDWVTCRRSRPSALLLLLPVFPAAHPLLALVSIKSSDRATESGRHHHRRRLERPG